MDASSGSIITEGRSVRSGMEGMSGLVGICPQHDLLWESLTGREHLLFYARLHALKVHHMQLVIPIAIHNSIIIIMQVHMKCLRKAHIDLKHIHNVETRFFCPQTFLTLHS